MQVTHVSDHATHAVLTAHKPIEMGITNDASFFQLLSAGLYSDQAMAVAREILCNAWDAHIDAGKTKEPILITLDEDKLIIKDFGHGIHHDKIGEIYGVYGNSTKKHDGQKTGGFGLGSKAPFAYTDHFEVTSCHQGVMTVYRMSGANVSDNGKPAIIPVLSVPTQDTGITVSIELKKPEDEELFENRLSQVITRGGINASLNGEIQETIEMDPKKEGFHLEIIGQLEYPASQKERIFVRYGAVMYPLPEDDRYINEYMGILAFLDRLYEVRGWSDSVRSKMGLVLMAAPHSIAVTPNRESLSMNERTANAVRELMVAFHQRTKKHRAAIHIKRRDWIQEAAKIDPPTMWSSTLWKPFKEKEDLQIALQSHEGIGDHLAASSGEGHREIRAHWIIDQRFKAFMQNMPADYDRGLVQSLYAVRKKHRGMASWISRRILGPALLRIRQSSLLKENRLYSRDNYGDLAPLRNFGRSVESVLDLLEFCKPKIVLATSKRDAVLACTKNTLVYLCTKSQKHIDEARKVFADYPGLVDVTEDPEIIERERKASIKKKYAPGIPYFVHCLDAAGNFDPTKLGDINGPRTLTPEFVFPVTNYGKDMEKNRNVMDEIFRDNNEHSQKGFIAFMKLYGHRGAASHTEPSMMEYIKNGALTPQEFMFRHALPEMKKIENKLKKLAATNLSKWFNARIAYTERDLFRALIRAPWFKELFKIPTVKLTPREQALAELYQAMRFMRHKQSAQSEKFEKFEEGIETTPYHESFKNIPITGSLHDVLDAGNLLTLLTSKDPVIQQRLKKIVTTALLG